MMIAKAPLDHGDRPSMAKKMRNICIRVPVLVSSERQVCTTSMGFRFLCSNVARGEGNQSHRESKLVALTK